MKKITKFNSFFSDEMYSEVKEYVDTLFKTKPEKFNTSLEWETGLVNRSALILRYRLTSDDVEMFQKIKKEMEKKIPYYIKEITVHVFPNLSYITWHSDKHVKAAFTVYLNEDWDMNWGGYLMYREDNEVKAIKPEKNLAVLQESGVNHCVTTVNVGADYRISLQCFLTDKKTII